MHVTEEHSSDDDLPAAQTLFQRASTKKEAVQQQKEPTVRPTVSVPANSRYRGAAPIMRGFMIGRSESKLVEEEEERRKGEGRGRRGGEGDDVTPGWMSLAAEEEWRRTPKREVSSGRAGLKDPR